ncbi:MAG: DUF4912 domain-containing protein [Planctomycetaceae bacterium]
MTAQGAGDLSSPRYNGNGRGRDQLSAVAHDARWIRVEWTLSPSAVQRARAAMGMDWFRAVPILRLFEESGGEEGGPSSELVRDVEIRADLNSWFLLVPQPERTYRVQIGYRTAAGGFIGLAGSRPVRMPAAGSRADGGRTETAISPEQRRHWLNARFAALEGVAAAGKPMSDGFPFHVDAQLTLRGTTHPKAMLTLMGAPVVLAEDGSFLLQFSLPDGRQVLPIIAITPDGSEQRTIVLAIERNTKHLEPEVFDDLHE